MGERAPQHIQNLVIRDYAARNDMDYLLSATEHAMKGSQIMLDQVLADMENLQGVIFYSIFQLPICADRRRVVYRKTIDAGCELHGAVEGLAVRNDHDAAHIEDIWRVCQALAYCPDAAEIRQLSSSYNV